MTDKFLFKLSSKSEQYCDMIVEEMERLFSISKQEAIGRVNRKWSGCSFEDESLLFHMLPEEWANEIYYGSNSMWWKKDKQSLIPVPFNEK
ncbi:hypothetical protein M6D81_31240 [Paenibacillus sp. J5C_2022]|uniref:hypothetical protein n=1 Tax=Paenibacillus sp. J5C2022 TaxID=2977129 RepID=UPI0021D2B108|nr:hypothetical protein [Paenibacillus sp. J5C2022]MCU6713182.1 hypothetical protein [Paenibacillus sp. J5C2022]